MHSKKTKNTTTTNNNNNVSNINKNKNRIKNNNNNNNNNNKNHSKFLICCRPLVMDVSAELVHEKGGDGGEPVLKYIKMEQNNGVLIPPILSLSSLDKETILQQKKKNQHRSFNGVLKAVFFETSLAKLIRKGKLKRKLFQSKGNLLAKVEQDASPMRENSMRHQEFSKKDDGRSMTSASTRPASSVSLNSRSSLERNVSFRSNSTKSKPKQDNVQEHAKGYYCSDTGLYTLLISLVILVFWGKAYAILCTSTWLFFMPHWRTGNNKLLKEVNSLETDSGEYKKKVIMEGLLQRNRSRGI